MIRRGVSVGDRVQILARGGQITIEEAVFIGTGCLIVSIDSIEIGQDTLIAEYVVIRDQNHRTDSRPVRLAGFTALKIRVGRDVWIGCKASILRGGGVGDRAVVGAHALVNSQIPEGMLAVGAPARCIGPV